MVILAAEAGTVRLTIPDAGTAKFHVCESGEWIRPSYTTVTMIGFDWMSASNGGAPSICFSCNCSQIPITLFYNKKLVSG